jgi:hypothetical protein
LHAAPFEVETGDLRHHDTHVAVAPEDGAERVGDLPGRERTGRDLVGERLEQVEVASIDDREVDRRGGEVLRGLQAAEPAADDDHPVPLTLRAIARAHDDRPRLSGSQRSGIRSVTPVKGAKDCAVPFCALAGRRPQSLRPRDDAIAS